MKDIFKIVLTGGPCGGKTTAINVVFERLTSLGYYVLVVPETATQFISGGIKPFGIAPLKVIDFQWGILKMQMDKEKLYYEMALHIPHNKIVIIFDRGLLDGKAFLSDEDFATISSRIGITEEEMLNTYDMVIHLVTAADGAEEFYTLENNKARTETKEQAILRDRRNIHCWEGHKNFKVIDNSTDFEGKMDRMMKEIYSLVGQPEVLDDQRRFLVSVLDDSCILNDASFVTTKITQDYLLNGAEGQRRFVRKCYIHDDYYYVLVEKYEIPSGKTYRRERRISYLEYQNLLMQKDPSLYTISKRRISFVDNMQYFELDLFESPDKLALLQVGMNKNSKGVSFPNFIKVIEEVTGHEGYRNYSIARK